MILWEQKNRVRVSDSFNRADNPTTLGNSDTGQPWIQSGATWGIVSNQAAEITSAAGRALIESSISNCAITCTFSVYGTDQRLAFRYTDSNNEYYVRANGGQYTLVRRQAGSLTTLATIPTAPQSGDVIRMEISVDSIVLKLNGSAVASVTSAFNQTATLHGLFLASDTTSRYDNFQVEAL